MKIAMTSPPCIACGVTSGREFNTINIGKPGIWIKGDNGDEAREF